MPHTREDDATHAGHADARRDGNIDHLLIRMESLGLDLGEVRRSTPSTFCKLANRCVTCECKERCERDLTYASAGIAIAGWENDCPNASALKAMKGSQWFGQILRESTSLTRENGCC
jgi:hypothetical protein